MSLAVRMYLAVGVLFAIVYAFIVIAGSLLGIGSFLLYGVIATALLLVQYLIGPKMVEWMMRVKYVTEKEEPELHRIVTELAQKAGIPKPRVGIADTPLPNAFAFGRWRTDARVCVTRGILQLLNKDELSAVLGHEISHVKNRDVIIITLISVIPTIAWHIAWSTMYSSDQERGGAASLGIAAFFIYFLTNLLVLYTSRIREYEADRGSIRLGFQPHLLASALYKLVYGTARTDRRDIKKVEGMKAFFANDPSRAAQEFAELKAVDANLSGSIDQKELERLRGSTIRISGGDKLMELLSTHPNMLKRISVLSKY